MAYATLASLFPHTAKEEEEEEEEEEETEQPKRPIQCTDADMEELEEFTATDERGRSKL